MTSSCDDPVSWESLVAYFSGELSSSSEDALEEHVFVCPTCEIAYSALAHLVEGLKCVIPPVLSDESLLALRRQGRVTQVVAVEPGGSVVLPFERPGDVVVCELRGPFSGYTALDLELSTKEGAMRLPGAPVGAGGSALRLVCYSSFPERFGKLIELSVQVPGQAGTPLAIYRLDHHVGSP